MQTKLLNFNDISEGMILMYISEYNIRNDGKTLVEAKFHSEIVNITAP